MCRQFKWQASPSLGPDVQVQRQHSTCGALCIPWLHSESCAGWFLMSTIAVAASFVLFLLQVLTGAFVTGYGPPSGFCYDMKCRDQPIQVFSQNCFSCSLTRFSACHF